MGIIMIRCPKTGKAVSTGMCIDRAVFCSMPVFFKYLLSVVPHLARVVCAGRMGLRLRPRGL